MYLRLQDPNGLLLRQRANLLPPHVRVLVVDPGSTRVHSAIQTAPGEFEYLVPPSVDMRFRVWSDDLNIEEIATARSIPANELIPQRAIPTNRKVENLPPGLSAMARAMRSDSNLVILRVRSAK